MGGAQPGAQKRKIKLNRAVDGLFYLHLVQHTGHLGQLVHVCLARDVKHVPQLVAPVAVDVRDPHLIGAARQRNVVGVEISEDFEQLRHRAACDVEVGGPSAR